MSENQITGKELLRAAVNRIIDHPEEWNQKTWHCGTAHCIGGHCQILAGLPATDNAGIDAARLIGLEQADADYVFDANRSMQEIYDFAQSFLNDEPIFGRDGYNRDGYNRAGYGRTGYDRAGHDRAGYDRTGYDRDGYGRTGYGRTGYDRTGHDRDGYDSAGYDRAGYGRDGDRRPHL